MLLLSLRDILVNVPVFLSIFHLLDQTTYELLVPSWYVGYIITFLSCILLRSLIQNKEMS